MPRRRRRCGGWPWSCAPSAPSAGSPWSTTTTRSSAARAARWWWGTFRSPWASRGRWCWTGRDLVPMATTEGCLVASTNRGCKAILEGGGARSVVYRDGMARAPVVQLPSVLRAAQLREYLQDPGHFEHISELFNSTSRYVFHATLAFAFLPLFPPAALLYSGFVLPCTS